MCIFVLIWGWFTVSLVQLDDLADIAVLYLSFLQVNNLERCWFSSWACKIATEFTTAAIQLTVPLLAELTVLYVVWMASFETSSVHSSM